MGERANYIVLGGGAPKMYFHPWGADAAPRSLIWGVNNFLQFAETLSPTRSLLADAYCEGAVLVDQPNKLALVWGNWALRYRPALRRVYLAWLSIAWPGWKVYWAHRGLPDLRAYLHEPAEGGPAGNACSQRSLSLAALASPSWHGHSSLAMVQWADGRQAEYQIGVETGAILCGGPGVLGLLDWTPPRPLPTNLAEDQQFGSLFVDVPRRRLVYGKQGRLLLTDDLAHTRGHWPDWDVNIQYGGMYDFCRASGLDWRPYLPERQVVVASLSHYLLFDRRSQPERLSEMFDGFGDNRPLGPADGASVYENSEPEIDPEEKRKWLEEILRVWALDEQDYEKSLARPDRLELQKTRGLGRFY
jgi:hypothetical protein